MFLHPNPRHLTSKGLFVFFFSKFAFRVQQWKFDERQIVFTSCIYSVKHNLWTHTIHNKDSDKVLLGITSS